MPISACIGTRAVMDAWPASTGEALHTQTFLGHPPGCAAALASIAVLEDEKLVERAAELGEVALAQLRAALAGKSGVVDVRGRGLLLAIECDTPERCLRVSSDALRRGVIVVPSGDDGGVIAITPPLSIDAGALDGALDVLAACFC
jgi:4-aminobutyrate aminotransferase-like enzyme